MGDAIDVSGLDQKVANAETKIGDAQENIDAWWANANKNNPINIAKHDAAISAITKASQVVSGLDQASKSIATSSVQYSMDKRPADKWNFIVGGQYQLNKHLMFRGEYGFLASRSQYIIGIQYRFRL